VHQRVLVALKVAKKFAEASLNAVDAGDVAYVLALRPAGESLRIPTKAATYSKLMAATIPE
jgi:hypothetical protein